MGVPDEQWGETPAAYVHVDDLGPTGCSGAGRVDARRAWPGSSARVTCTCRPIPSRAPRARRRSPVGTSSGWCAVGRGPASGAAQRDESGEERVRDDIVVSSYVTESGTVRLNRPDRGNSVTPDVVTPHGRCGRRPGRDRRHRCRRADRHRQGVLRRRRRPGHVRGLQRRRCRRADGLPRRHLDAGRAADGAAVVERPGSVVAAYNGAATAGGLDFGLSCDVRLAASDRGFAESYVNLGMVPVAGGAYLLPS